jgi:hypothetical protein
VRRGLEIHSGNPRALAMLIDDLPKTSLCRTRRGYVTQYKVYVLPEKINKTSGAVRSTSENVTAEHKSQTIVSGRITADLIYRCQQ